MQIVVKANPSQKSVFQQMLLPDTIQLIWHEDGNIGDADAYFDCCYDTEGWAFGSIQHRPVFVNSVLVCADGLPGNAIRFNAWDGFLVRPIWELASRSTEFKTAAELVLMQMNKAFAWVPDQPGLIAARVIAMVINEAFFAYGDGLTDKASIDIAMKLGTNYPYGPFEWADLIGVNKIIDLLYELKKGNDRYSPAPKLLEALSITTSNTIQ